MIAIDTNVLVYAHREGSPKYQAARARLAALSGLPDPWGIPVTCLAEFSRVVSHPQWFDQPFPTTELCVALRRILALPGATVLYPGADHPALFEQAIQEGNAAGNLVFDAQIVAICRERGVSLFITEDRDFDRFDFNVERIAAGETGS